MAPKRIRALDDGSANVASTDSMAVDRTGLDEAERVTLAQAVTASGVVASAVSTHSSDTTSVHGIADTSVLETTSGAQSKADAAQAAAVQRANHTGTQAASTISDFATAADARIAAANPSDMAPDAPLTESGTSFTLSATHAQETVRCTNASAVTVTIPTDAADDLPDGYWCALFAEGAGGVTLELTGITPAGLSPNTTIAQNEVMVVMKTAAANTWLIFGATAA